MPLPHPSAECTRYESCIADMAPEPLAVENCSPHVCLGYVPKGDPMPKPCVRYEECSAEGWYMGLGVVCGTDSCPRFQPKGEPMSSACVHHNRCTIENHFDGLEDQCGPETCPGFQPSRECALGLDRKECVRDLECGNCPFWRATPLPEPPRLGQLCGARLVINSVPEVLHLAVRANTIEQAADLVKAYCRATYGTDKVISNLGFVWTTGDVLVVGKEN